VWRQDHNAVTHQDPGFIDLVANKKADIIRVYLPPDANTLLAVSDRCLRKTTKEATISVELDDQGKVAGVMPSPTMNAAETACIKGALAAMPPTEGLREIVYRLRPQ